MSESAQEVWDRYYADIKARRLSEAETLWSNMTADGVSSDTVLAMDFVHFSQDRDGANVLQKQLSGNYNSSVSQQDDAWIITSTTRPHGIGLDGEQHKSWVEFMCDVAHPPRCVFSTWSFESPELKRKWSTEEIDGSQYAAGQPATPPRVDMTLFTQTLNPVATRRSRQQVPALGRQRGQMIENEVSDAPLIQCL